MVSRIYHTIWKELSLTCMIIIFKKYHGIKLFVLAQNLSQSPSRSAVSTILKITNKKIHHLHKNQKIQESASEYIQDGYTTLRLFL